MVIYEVNLDIKREIYPEFKSWLDEHIQDMLKIPGFIQASLLQEVMDKDSDSSLENKITVQYQLNSLNELQKYFDEYAPKMRGDGIERFKDFFKATRRSFEVEEIITRNNT